MSGMDFFGHQEYARRASRRLLMLYGLTLLALIVGIYLLAQLLLVAADAPVAKFDLRVFGAVTLGVGAVVGLASAWKTAQLRTGGGAVAAMLGGRRVAPAPTDPKERMLRNVVEEMAIASGLPVPDLFVLDGESGINAFAAGWGTADAAVAVTRGCLDQLDRDEVQGIVAHEFSHVFHGDMRLNIRLIGVLFGIVCIATIGRVLARSGTTRRSSRKNEGGIVVFGIALVAIGYLGVFLARLLQAAVSRQREFLADASAVQYTRNPHGIGMALARIGGHSSRLASPHADEASHMLFADGVVRWFGNAFATHPPLATRIERILPGYQRSNRSLAEAVASTPKVASTPIAGVSGLGGVSGAAVAAGPEGALAASALAAMVGDVSASNVAAAHDLLDALPLELTAAAREPQRAKALVLALLLQADDDERDDLLRSVVSDAGLHHDCRALFLLLQRLDRHHRLPLFELAVPALRALPEADKQQLRRDARALALADGELSAFEFALLFGLVRHVRLASEPTPRPPRRPKSLVESAGAANVVLAKLAHAGATDSVAAAHAFAAGLAAAGLPAQPVPLAEPSPAVLEAAVRELGEVSLQGKRNLLAACAAAVAADGVVAIEELELVRALSELWDCPLPLVATGTAASAPTSASGQRTMSN